MDIVESFEKEFVDKKRIWERVKTERLDLSDTWVANVRNAINSLSLYSEKLLMSIASYALVTNGCRGTHGYPSPGALVSTWLYNPSFKNAFSMQQVGSLLQLAHFFKAV